MTTYNRRSLAIPTRNASEEQKRISALALRVDVHWRSGRVSDFAEPRTDCRWAAAATLDLLSTRFSSALA
ncbi:MAG TPA: hypothetical protein VHB99_04330, partial [Pirellulales bacterium]|nr:hypothetical protein [Pirellulales bacterium]